MSTRLAWFSACVAVLLTWPAAAEAQQPIFVNGVVYNPFVVPVFNPFPGPVVRTTGFVTPRGRYVATRRSVNPVTGRMTRTSAYFNPWTGNSGVVRRSVNPWTGRRTAAVRRGWW
jgi:hypothetical protein